MGSRAGLRRVSSKPAHIPRIVSAAMFLLVLLVYIEPGVLKLVTIEELLSLEASCQWLNADNICPTTI